MAPTEAPPLPRSPHVPPKAGRHRDRAWVELDLAGEVPERPVQWVFGVDSPAVQASLRFDPTWQTPPTLSLDGVEARVDPGTSGAFLAASLRHLFELPFSMDSADVLTRVADRDGHRRLFASWGAAAPRRHTDQLILWISEETGLISRFDTTGRDIAPFIVARVIFEGVTEVEGFTLPRRVVVWPDSATPTRVHAWTLTAARVGPPR